MPSQQEKRKSKKQMRNVPSCSMRILRPNKSSFQTEIDSTPSLVTMNRIAELVLIFSGIFFLLLGVVFLMAGVESRDNLMIGGVLLLVALGVFSFIFVADRIPANSFSQQDQPHQGYSDKESRFIEKKLVCSSCGAPIKAHKVKETDEGLMVACISCGNVSILQEQPKW